MSDDDDRNLSDIGELAAIRVRHYPGGLTTRSIGEQLCLLEADVAEVMYRTGRAYGISQELAGYWWPRELDRVVDDRLQAGRAPGSPRR